MGWKVISRTLFIAILTLLCVGHFESLFADNAVCEDPLLASTIFNPGFSKEAQDAHGAITHDLYTGRIFSVEPFGKDGNNHGLYRARIEGRDPFTGESRIREAFFKPRIPGDEDGWSRTPMEYFAYFLNRKLGMDYVPPVVLRHDLAIEFHGQHFGEGAFMYSVPHFRTLHSLPYAKYAKDHEAIASDNRVLNVLLQNQDAHSKNLGVGIHWVDGKEHPVFIDFGAAMREGTSVSMTRYAAYENSDPVTKIRQQTYDNLKNLRHFMFYDAIHSGVVSDQEVWDLLGRAQGIVSYFDHLQQQALVNGRGSVFLR